MTWRRAAVGLLALAAWAPQTTPDVRVAVARADVRADPTAASPAFGSVRYGEVLPVLPASAADGDWAHVTVFVGTVRVDGFVSNADVVPAPAGAAVDADMRMATGLRPGGTSRGSAVAIAIDAGGRTNWLAGVSTRAVPVTGPKIGLDELAASADLAQAIAGLAQAPPDPAAAVTWTWLVPASRVTTTVPSAIVVTALYGDVPGLPPDTVMPVIVRLPPAGPRWRAVASARGRFDAPFDDGSNWTIASVLAQDAVAGQQADGAPGAMKIRLGHALAPGDYAVIFRPVFARATAGATVFAGAGLAPGESIIFGLAWPFRIA